jgi:hypothetical protein
MKYQVTILDKTDFILEYKDFSDKEIGPMVRYINKQVTESLAQTIKIERWNDRGEKA